MISMFLPVMKALFVEHLENYADKTLVEAQGQAAFQELAYGNKEIK